MKNDLDFIELNRRVKGNGGWKKSMREVRNSNSYRNDTKRRWLVRALKISIVAFVVMFLHEGITCPDGKHYQQICFFK